MKKQFFYAALAIALMSSCSKDNEPVNPTDPTPENPGVIDDTKPAEIKLGINAPNIVATRGTGSVGDISGKAENVWNGQTLNILMFEKGTTTKVMDGGAYIFDGETFQAPLISDNVSAGKIKFLTGNVKYYPVSGAFDFYGYHVDAAGATYEDNTTTVTATINGTNDIMAATTRFTAADTVAVINDRKDKKATYKISETGETQGLVVTTEGVLITDDANSADLALVETELAKAYSAYAARRGVHPNLVFKHMLSRLKFKVYAGEANAAETNTLKDEGQTQGNNATPKATTGAAYIESIKITGTPADGTTKGTAVGIKDQISLQVAPTPALTATISNATNAFTLMQLATDHEPAAELVDLEPTAPATFDDGTTGYLVGESMMIVPGDKNFMMTVAIRQFVQTNDGTGTGTEKWEWKSQSFDVIVNAPANEADGDAFAQGKSYNINITVYGFQKIEVTASLEGWIEGGDIPVNPEDF